MKGKKVLTLRFPEDKLIETGGDEKDDTRHYGNRDN